MAPIERYDLVVIGAGFYGLAMAKTYLQLNPQSSLAILDEGSDVGGVWGKDRLYPLLKTNNQFPGIQFSDFPIVDDTLVDGQHIPGPIVNRYLGQFADAFDLTRRVQVGSRVRDAEIQPDSTWILKVVAAGKERRVATSRLVVACGQTSEPRMPNLKGVDSYENPLFHSREYAMQAPQIKDAKNVVVVGGAKSGYDVAYALASTGVQVHWVIRKSGAGPSWMAPSRVTPLKILAERMITKRFISFLSPCVWGDNDGYDKARWFLNKTQPGRRFMARIVRKIQWSVEMHNGYDSHPETAKLKPWHDLFWVGTNRGLLNFDGDIFSYVKSGQIKVYIDEISHFSSDAVHLVGLSDNSTELPKPITLPADAVVCCTGWKAKPSTYFHRGGEDISAELGLPHQTDSGVPSSHELRADEELLTRFPMLRNSPALKTRPATEEKPDARASSSYQLYRFMVPPAHMHSRTIAFSGAIRTGTTPLLAQTQALWITAFFADELPHIALPPASAPSLSFDKEASHLHKSQIQLRDGDISPTPASEGKEQDHDRFSKRTDSVSSTTSTTLSSYSSTTASSSATAAADDAILYETTLHARFLALRYPTSRGAQCPDFFFDALPYMDLMLKELGLRRWRKRNALAEIFESYVATDYVGLVDEWKAVRARAKAPGSDVAGKGQMLNVRTAQSDYVLGLVHGLGILMLVLVLLYLLGWLRW